MKNLTISELAAKCVEAESSGDEMLLLDVIEEVARRGVHDEFKKELHK